MNQFFLNKYCLVGDINSRETKLNDIIDLKNCLQKLDMSTIGL